MSRTLEASVPATEPERPLTDPSFYLNRELSWLDFNRRVLAQVLDESHPLLERVKFLAIVGANLNEFFMIRVASLLRKQRTGTEDVSTDGMTTEEQLVQVRRQSADMLAQQAKCWTRNLRPQLEAAHVHFLDPVQYTPAITQYLETYFARDIWPVLTPLAFDPGHPFPDISNLSLNLAVVVKHGSRRKFARVKIPDVLPRFIPVPERFATRGAQTFAFLEDVIRANLQRLFPGTTVKGAYLFRVIRDADLVIQEDEADDLLESIDKSLRERRHGALSMLKVESGVPRRVLDTLIENFEIEEENVFRTKERLGFGDWIQLASLHRPELKYPPFKATSTWVDEDAESIFAELRSRDRMVHHPFQSFGAVEAFLRAAVSDPQVLGIKMTLYRIGANSPMIDLLLTAADEGKQVAVLVELKARFDERNNIQWAQRLEAAGVHVVYGLLNLKTHCKLCLVVRKEAEGIRRYAHLGTGNYNATTSRLYTDLGLFTSRDTIVEDASDLFNYLTGYSNQHQYRELLVAPVSLRSSLTQLIAREAAAAEAGQPSGIVIKVNAVTDPEMVRHLYRASQAGVVIQLLVRGVCILRPGVPGISDNISVRSIIGRFLEHSRLFWFANGGDPCLYIGSADIMERNLDRRVEVLCPIRDVKLATYLRDVVLAAYLRDTRRGQVLAATGEYGPDPEAPVGQALSAQDLLLDWHAAEAKTDW
ncbi:MAG: polyphosphate kinase 1 [Acidobacteria bacterium]|nr:polyphosphate kinase 1 [Acidobacteriota bacterium]